MSSSKGFLIQSPRSAAAAGGAAVYAGLGAAARFGATRSTNRAVRRRVHPRRSKNVTALATAISKVAAPHTHPFVAAAIALAVSRVRGRGAPSIVMASLCITALDKLSRVVVHQERPATAHKHRGLDKYAYPSGHTCAMTAIGVAAASEIAEAGSPALTETVWFMAVTSALAVGWSRL